MSFFHFKRLSLKARFIYAFVFVIMITITILSLTNHFRWRANYLRQLRDEGLILTQTLTLGSVHPIITHNFYSLEEFAKNLTKKRNIAYVMIMDRHDRILVQKPDDLGTYLMR
jgi:sensor histidine kinase regulating citrate/malate metabolism